MEDVKRRLPIGAELQPDGATHFRVWAPGHRKLELVLEASAEPGGSQLRGGKSRLEMQPEADGYFALLAPGVPAGTRYRYRIDGAGPYPDPASRYQPEGPEGPSQVIDPGSFAWSDGDWPGVHLPGQVLYEMHVGTFTTEGTWRAAASQLAELAELGVTLLEIMPVADWPGDFGWGYDGVNLFAPMRLYGKPDDFRALVDRAHALGIGVLLDVVYNHVGTGGCTWQQFSSAYFTDRHENEWGSAINFDGNGSLPVREFFLANTRYWIEEFHLDGYRIDAAQAFHDDSPEHILAAITRVAREAAGRRSILLVAESEPQDAQLVRPLDRGGYGMDAVWNDDFHHSATVRLTGRSEAYFTDYRGTADEFVALIRWGYLYQGQRYEWQHDRRGSPAFDLPPATFVNYLQNHDQVANTGCGPRLDRLSSPSQLRAVTALWLLMPQTPLLFQGQEFAASGPFCYFLDNPPDRAEQVSAGRAKFLKQFPSLALDEIQRRLPDPADPLNYRKCKLKFAERAAHAEIYALHKDLLAIRRSDPAIAAQRRDRIEAAALSRDALVVRYFEADGADRLLVANFGADLHYDPAPQPLLAPPKSCRWEILWSSENPRYGGSGTPPLDTDENWRVPAEATVLLKAVVES
jgi:maltooligosyltrehalose trehalohydrolase